MPELPEVETVRRQLDERLRDKTISRVSFYKTGREFPLGDTLVSLLEGKRICEIQRRAKLLIWKFTDETALIAHLKMTGRFVFVDSSFAPAKHDRAFFEFSDSTSRDAHEMVRLVWSDIRQFGFLKFVSPEELSSILSSYGPEPLDHPPEHLADRFKLPKTRNLKSALLNQEVIAGVGNIYADEALHRARLMPTRRLGSLTARERLRLAEEIQNVLRESLAQQGTSANDYVDTRGEKGGFLKLLRVYGREGEACQTCGTSIQRMVVVQRGTHYCPVCQD
jgi:formamidopyrimidine-DNA glycosylase